MCIHETLVYEKDSGPVFCELKATSLGLPSSSEGSLWASAESCHTYRQSTAVGCLPLQSLSALHGPPLSAATAERHHRCVCARHRSNPACCLAWRLPGHPGPARTGSEADGTTQTRATGKGSRIHTEDIVRPLLCWALVGDPTVK